MLGNEVHGVGIERESAGVHACRRRKKYCGGVENYKSVEKEDGQARSASRSEPGTMSVAPGAERSVGKDKSWKKGTRAGKCSVGKYKKNDATAKDSARRSAIAS